MAANQHFKPGDFVYVKIDDCKAPVELDAEGPGYRKRGVSSAAP